MAQFLYLLSADGAGSRHYQVGLPDLDGVKDQEAQRGVLVGVAEQRMRNRGAVLQAVAGYLGLSDEKLRDQLESGKSLADIATAQGKSVAGLKDTILTAVTKQINSATWINAAQKSALITDVKSHLGDIVNATCTSGGSPSASPSGPSSSWSGGSPSGSASASVGGP